MNLIFIENEILDLDKFKNSINNNAKYIIYNNYKLFSEIEFQIRNFNILTYECIAFVFIDENGKDKFFVESKTFMSQETKKFINKLISIYSVQNVDFLASNLLSYQNWREFFSTINAKVRASEDKIGNSSSGGNCIFDLSNENIENLYLNSNLKYWNHSLDISSKIISITCGGTHVAVLTESGNVYMCGKNNRGQLGNETINESEIFRQIKFPPEIKIMDVSCGYNYTVILTQQKDIYVFGSNKIGQLGLPENYAINKDLIKINLAPNITPIKIVSGSCHNVILTNTGDAYAFGNNSSKQLGIENIDENFLKKINIDEFIKDISCGFLHTCILTDKENVYAFGNNNFGQLGIELNIAKLSTPTKINLPNNISIKKISCGYVHTAILTHFGDIYTFGKNKYGQLGNGTNDDSNLPIKINIPADIQIIDLLCGPGYTIILTNSGDLYSFGKNKWGELCNSGENNNIPLKVNLPYKINSLNMLSCNDSIWIVSPCGEIITFRNKNSQLKNTV
jgi:hypothetical protein